MRTFTSELAMTAKLGMAMLKNGGSAVDAVEIAIKTLEDKEITNSGYGSNLTIAGTVECDATIVDHYGRSGAVGAVSQIKNPISLARIILDSSTRPLTLQRVPPNLLVGAGATDFAYEQGMPVLPHDFLVSAAARERWARWKNDLDLSKQHAQQQSGGYSKETRAQGTPPWVPIDMDSPVPAVTVGPPSPKASPRRSLDPRLNRVSSTGAETIVRVPPKNAHGSGKADRTSFDTIGDANSADFNERGTQEACDGDGPAKVNDGSCEFDSVASSISSLQLPSAVAGTPPVPTRCPPLPPTPAGLQQVDRRAVEEGSPTLDEKIKHHMVDASSQAEDRRDNNDNIIDTVGAIAIDKYGNIAAGSSSGGIGMKHCGRTGPAALVGVGTAVIPVDPDDPEKVCVATVTSGTGEHMATTMAAHACADRLYSCVERGKNGEYEEIQEDEAMKTMIQKHFMDHPGVKTSHCQAAIGIMGVKKTRDGVFLYFGHNTDSFASLSINDTGNGSIAQGGRAAKFNRYRAVPMP
ncbi:hypothetical protein FQN54_006210 [Arachnomyces sp. PD_36]|nr:hypothetical protein FQN54_006210 [Arachnomyces sp. PD_36]